ncbi:NTF2 fold immunity protein [Eleftheria terrae]|uniref:NTF2 fold immunity protein n=1 Tax=Eleftheria terrae TaxID=1597781 RepID=UPI00341F4CAA
MAAELAEIYISNICGQQAADQQRPYGVNEHGDCWQVEGVLQKLQPGGIFEIHIAKEDGKVLLLRHSR